MATFSVCSASSLRPLRLRAFDRSSQSHRRAHRERPTSFMDQSQTQALVRANGFRWKDFDAYLFDIDGTLLVTRDLVHYNALNRSIRDVYEVEATIDGIPYHGTTDLELVRAVVQRDGTS